MAEQAPLKLPSKVRLTPQRHAILEAVAASGKSFTALELCEHARRSCPQLGLATTYRTLELLRQAGSVHLLRSDEAPAYVRCRPEHHHHLVCSTCGAVEETDLCAVPPASELRRRYGFTVESHELELYGTCSRCTA